MLVRTKNLIELGRTFHDVEKLQVVKGIQVLEGCGGEI